eukprot:COSAG01_NODE_6508_length_3628_cov_3.822329_1_plen_40_part_10
MVEERNGARDLVGFEVPCLDMALGYSISLEKSGSHDDLFF